MRNILLSSVVLFSLLGCKKRIVKNTQIDHTITRSYNASNGQDSIAYFYNVDNQLLATDKLVSGKYERLDVKYESSRIIIGDDYYYYSDGFQIDSIIRSENNVTCYTYSNGKIINEKILRTGTPRRIIQTEISYVYSNGNLLKLSSHSPLIGVASTITYIYTDTLMPEFYDSS